MKRLKQVHILPFLLLAAGISGLFSCTQEGLPGEDAGAIGNNGNGGNSTQTFSISVSDGGGYASAEPSTRAEENGYQTSFTAGDQIGVFAVKNGAIVADVNNLCLTAENNSGVIEWPIPANTTLPADATYYAYYPYRSPLTGNPAPAATDASAFFANVISQWTPDTDQRDYTKYTAQDLMIAKGDVSGNSLTFSMKHQMALVVLDLPTYKYKLNTDNTYTWTISATSDKGCLIGDTYRYLIKPGTNISVSGTCISSYNEEWSTTTTISAGKFKMITINGGKDGPIQEKSHTLQVGDYYMKDGSGNAWLKSKDATLTEADKSSCLGIVIKVGKDNSGDWMDECEYKLKNSNTPMSTIHGYVLALHDGNNGNTCKWCTTYNIEVHTSTNDKFFFNGYSDMQMIKKSKGEYRLEEYFPAAYHASNGYETIDGGKYASPISSSGWFLPSGGQCWYWYQNSVELQTYIDNAGGSMRGGNFYWSSSENSIGRARRARYVDFDLGNMNTQDKDKFDANVRSWLAF